MIIFPPMNGWRFKLHFDMAKALMVDKMFWTRFILPDMKPIAALLFYVVIIVISLTSWKAAGADTNAVPVSPFAPIEFLVGGTWHGDLPSAPNEPKGGIESKFEWAGNHQGIRFESAWVIGDKRRPYCSGIYVWNPGKQQLEIVYTDSKGALIEGSVKLADSVIQHDLKIVDKTGKEDLIQARMTHPDAMTYVNEIYMMEDGKWQKLVSVRYEKIEPVAADQLNK